MESLIGNSFWVFFFVTLIIAGGAAFMMGQVIARTWRPAWQGVLYSLLLTAADRFMIYALFDGVLLSIPGFLFDAAVLTAIAMLAFRLTRARKMVTQYPWLYESAGPFHWREKPHAR